MATVTKPLMLDETGQAILDLLNSVIVTPQVIDNLTTADPTKALSANQGKVLKDMLPDLATTSINDWYNSASFYSFDYAKYVVKNGIAFVAIDFMSRSAISSYVYLFGSSKTLPFRPACNSFYVNGPCPSGASTPVLYFDSYGRIEITNVQAGTHYYFSIAYPCEVF